MSTTSLDQHTVAATQASALETAPGSRAQGWGEAGFYSFPGAVQRLDRLYYLVLYRRLVPVISGPEGAGKTQLLLRLAERVRGNCRVALVRATKAMDASGLMQECIHALGLGNGEDHGSDAAGLDGRIDVLREYLDRPQPRPRTVLLIVDDAQRLDFGLLGFLLSLPGRLEGTTRQLRLMLSGRPELTEHLARVGRGGPVLHVEQLAPFTPERARDYLRHCLRTIGLRGEGPFDAEEMDRIYKESGGWPGKLDALARQALDGYVPRAKGLSGRPWLGWSLGSLLVVGLLAGLWAHYQERIELAMRSYWPAPVVSTTDHPATPLEAASAVAASPPTDGETRLDQGEDPQSLLAPSGQAGEGWVAEVVQGFGEDQGRELTPLLQESVRAVLLNTKPEHVAQLDVQRQGGETGQDAGESAGGSTAARGVESKQVGEVPEAPAITQQTAPRVDASEPANPRPSILHKDDWILAQDPAKWTLQLLAANGEGPLVRFFAAHRDHGPWAYYYIRSKGKDWYSLVYGLYPSQPEAEAAVDDLPFLVEEPWVRRLDAIQASIRRAGRR